MMQEAANHGNRTVCDRRIIAEEIKTVRNTLGPDFLDDDMDVDHLFESNRLTIIAIRIDSRKTEFVSVDFADHGKVETAQQRVLGLFHIHEEVREMRDASHVRVTELDSPSGFENF